MCIQTQRTSEEKAWRAAASTVQNEAVRVASDENRKPLKVVEVLWRPSGAVRYEKVPIFRNHRHINTWLKGQPRKKAAFIVAFMKKGNYVGVSISKGKKKEIGKLVESSPI